MYKPNPINTDDVILSAELLNLTEKLAENTHEVWAKGRVRDGWKYGRERNDERKETPCLVPYFELTDEEKSYDRSTALETLKLIIKLGYTITKT